MIGSLEIRIPASTKPDFMGFTANWCCLVQCSLDLNQIPIFSWMIGWINVFLIMVYIGSSLNAVTLGEY